MYTLKQLEICQPSTVLSTLPKKKKWKYKNENLFQIWTNCILFSMILNWYCSLSYLMKFTSLIIIFLFINVNLLWNSVYCIKSYCIEMMTWLDLMLLFDIFDFCLPLYIKIWKCTLYDKTKSWFGCIVNIVRNQQSVLCVGLSRS